MASNLAANISQAGLLQGFSAGAPILYASYAVAALLVALVVYNSRDQYPELPWLNPKGPTELTTSRRRAEFMANPRKILKEGTEKFGDKPYKIITENGPYVMLPHKYASELKSDRNLDFGIVAAHNSHAYLPGFDPLATPDELPQIINRHLTKALLSLTKPISLETTEALKDVFGENSKEWTEITPAGVMLVVSRMSSRIFMGKELCNDREWIQRSSEYVSAMFSFGYALSGWPTSIRRIVNVFHPEARRVRQLLDRCRKVLQPHLDKRQAVVKEAEARGEKNPYNDAISWFQQEVPGEVDPASAQISLSIVAIHTTSDLLSQTMHDLAKNPHLIAPLRQEVIEVLSTHGLKKTAFQKLVLMDSCFKETQRLKPILNAYFIRIALKDVRLSDGFLIKKGTCVSVDGTLMQDDNVYSDPFRYDPYRFMEMRNTAGEENKSHLVSVSQNHFGFGHGIHACPGRFFAANEVKIALAHILLKYDWKLAPGSEDLQPLASGNNYVLNPNIKFMVRYRQPELDLASLEF